MALAVHLRFLARRKAVALAAVLAMGLALAANTAALSVLRAFLLSDLGVPTPDRVLLIAPERPLPGRGEVIFNEAWPNYQLLRESRRAFGEMTAFTTAVAAWEDDGVTRPLQSTVATATFFATFGVGPALGRTFTAEEEGPSPAPVVVLSDAVWRRDFQADPAVVGTAITLNGIPTTVIGVMPPRFAQPVPTDIWQPFDLTEGQRNAITGGRLLTVFGRLADGRDHAAAVAEAREFTERTRAASPADNRDYHYIVQTLREQLLAGADDTVLLVQAGAAVLLLLAVLNLATVLVAWGFDRRRELAVRLTLGAGEGRVTGLLLGQSGVIVGAGLVAGLGLAAGALRIVRGIDLGPQLGSLLVGARLDWNVLLLSGAVAAGAALLAGLLPAWLGRGTDLADALRASSRGATLSRAALRWQQGMVVVQAALSIVVLAAAVLVAWSFRNLNAIPDGFDPEGRGVARVALPAEFRTHAQRVAFGEALAAAFARDPSVRSWGFSNTLPVGDPGWGGRFFIPAVDGGAEGEPLLFHFRRVSPGYLAAMGIPLLRGRPFEVQDDSTSVGVAIVSEALAAQYYPDGDAVGRQLLRVAAGGATEPLLIVGVAGNVMDGGPAADPGQAVYVPFAQVSVSRLSIVAQGAATPEAAIESIRRAVAAASPVVAATGTASLATLALQVNALPRLRAMVLLALAVVAVTLIGLGSYGVMRQLVLSREREYALRIVFGARPGDVAGRVYGQVARLTVPGAVLGVVGAWLAAGLLGSFLFGIEARSLPVLGAVGLGVAALAALAAAPSALRAARIDPTEMSDSG